jgi:hypothetical protein
MRDYRPSYERKIKDIRKRDNRPVRLNKPKTPEYITFATQQVMAGNWSIDQAKAYAKETAKARQKAALKRLWAEKAGEKEKKTIGKGIFANVVKRNK